MGFAFGVRSPCTSAKSHFIKLFGVKSFSQKHCYKLTSKFRSKFTLRLLNEFKNSKIIAKNLSFCDKNRAEFTKKKKRKFGAESVGKWGLAGAGNFVGAKSRGSWAGFVGWKE